MGTAISLFIFVAVLALVVIATDRREEKELKDYVKSINDRFKNRDANRSGHP